MYNKPVKKILLFLLLLTILLALPHSTLALKKRVRFVVAGVSFSSAKLSRGTNSVVLTLLNLNRVSKITYTLSYSANGIEQGVVGSITPAGQATDSRDLYFGTCSKGVCTPHYNITNASLLVETTLTNGAVNAKRYRIKI